MMLNNNTSRTRMLATLFKLPEIAIVFISHILEKERKFSENQLIMKKGYPSRQG